MAFSVALDDWWESGVFIFGWFVVWGVVGSWVDRLGSLDKTVWLFVVGVAAGCLVLGPCLVQTGSGAEGCWEFGCLGCDVELAGVDLCLLRCLRPGMDTLELIAGLERSAWWRFLLLR